MAKRGKHKYHLGTKNIYADECPEGYEPGWVYKEGAFDGAVEKRKKTCLERYGTSAYNNSEKNKRTCLERYGATTWMHSTEGSEVIKQSLLEKYGVDSPFKSRDVQLKAIRTTALNLGYTEEEAEKFTNVSQMQEIRSKIEDTCIERYNSENYLGSLDCREKTADYYLSNYGVDCYSKTSERNDVVAKTNIERYGVPWYCMTSDCRNKSSNDSIPNKQFAKLLEDNNIQYEREFSFGGYSYDFKINNYLVEINPSATHNSTWGIFNKGGLDYNYHMNKSHAAASGGYQCVHLFDWEDPNKIIKLISGRETIGARKCSIREVSKSDAKEFLEANHIQGYVNDSIRLGLFDDCGLISIMTFGKPRYNKNYEYELLRYCSIKNVSGGAEKLFSHFKSSYSPASVISYCDSSKFSGNVYEKLGFTLTGTRKPSKHWYNLKTRKHITNNLLLQRGFDQLFGTNFGKGISNDELMRNAGFVEIFDSGQLTYIYKQ